jgi:hypothetical protein
MLSKMSICTFEIPGIFVLVLTVPTSLAAWKIQMAVAVGRQPTY